MNNTIRGSTIRRLTLVVMVLAGLAGGCIESASSNRKPVSYVDQIRADLATARSEVDAMVATLQQLRAGHTDLQLTLEQFRSQLTAIQRRAAEVDVLAAEMGLQQLDYAARLKKAGDPQLASDTGWPSPEQRHDEARQVFAAVNDTYRRTRAGYFAFHQRLQEVKNALANDPAPGDVQMASPALDNAILEGQALGRQVDNLAAQLEHIEKARPTKP